MITRGTGMVCLLVAMTAGCQGDALTPQRGGFTARLLDDGSLRVESVKDSKTIQIPRSKLYNANAVMGLSYGKAGLGPWCVVDCHLDPSTSIFVAWNPITEVVRSSAGYTWGIISSNEGQLVTIHQIHYSPADEPETVYVNDVELRDVPSYNWKFNRSDCSHVEFIGKSEANQPMDCVVTYGGTWRSARGYDYDVYHVYFTLQMEGGITNIRGINRVFFIRNGEVQQSIDGYNAIRVQGHQLLEEGGSGQFGPWRDANDWISDL